MTSTASSRRASSRALRLAAIGAGAFGWIATAVAAPASPSPTSDATIAETLFQEGKALMKQGELARACPKLAESQRLDPASGTCLALAICLEQQGKLATAWTNYLETEALARKDGNADRAKAARERASALAPKLARLEIVVGEEVRSLPELELRFDGVQISSAVWGTAMPVDPGEHVIEVRAKGKLPGRTSVTIQGPAERQRIEIGPLQDAPPEPAPAAAAATAPPEGSKVAPAADGADASSTAGLVAGGVIGGLGLVALGIGTYFGVRALDQIGTAQDRCTPALCTDAEAVDLNEEGALSADVSTGLLIGGGVATAAGVVILIVAGLGGDESASSAEGAASTAALRVLPMVGLGAAGLAIGGAW